MRFVMFLNSSCHVHENWAAFSHGCTSCHLFPSQNHNSLTCSCHNNTHHISEQCLTLACPQHTTISVSIRTSSFSLHHITIIINQYTASLFLHHMTMEWVQSHSASLYLHHNIISITTSSLSLST